MKAPHVNTFDVYPYTGKESEPTAADLRREARNARARARRAQDALCFHEAAAESEYADECLQQARKAKS